ncbi:MAG TPA: alpha/beta fold hydrolase [Opitutaceae bacterium]
MNPSRLRFLIGFVALTAFSGVRAADVAFDWFEYSGKDELPTPEVAASEFRNPVLTGFYPDPSVCQVGDDYYLINSTFAYFPGIPIFHSRDLVNWSQLGHVIDRPQQLPYAKLGVSRGLFAPAISHHNGTFYVVCTMIDAGGNFVVTASDPRGPWSDPTWLHFEGIDPSLFFDDDGRAWMINNGAPVGTPLYDGHRAVWIQEFDPVAKKMIGPRTVLVNGGVDISQKPVWIEGPHIYKRDGWYYLCCAEGGTSVKHSQVIFRSRKVDGPYVPWSENPMLTQRDLSGNAPFSVTSTGHADLVIGPDGQWWSVFLGVRPYDGRFSPMGRETFLLPVTWTDDGWPRILEKGKRVPLVVKAPKGVSPKPSPERLNGNFAWRDDFTGPSLSPLWIMLRTPSETWWNVDGAAGRLALRPRADRLDERGNPSFLARRVQHARFTASTALELPVESGVSAGLAVFQGERFHYFLAVKREPEGAVVYLEKLGGNSPEIVSKTRIQATGRLELRVDASDARCTFAYAAESGAWKTLVADADAKLLTTEVAGGFVGATVGVHARLDAPARAAGRDAGGEGKPTFVIVHGAWAGGWEHKRLAEALQAEGHTVYRATLTGQGERSHLASPEVDLSTHIQDVVNLIEWENLQNVVLIGHSYGGMVITGVADRVSRRLKHVIYLDAFLPEDGESAYTSMGPERRRLPATDGFVSIGDESSKPVPHIVPQSERTFSEPIKLQHQEDARRIPTTYILTVDPGREPAQDMFYRYYERAKARGWKAEVMVGDHVVHLSKTKETAARLEAVVE